MHPLVSRSSVLPRACWHSAKPNVLLTLKASSSYLSLRRYSAATTSALVASRSSSSFHLTSTTATPITAPQRSLHSTAATTTAAITASSLTRPTYSSIVARSAIPLAQISKRYCSYRRMCHSRRADESLGSTTVAGREVLPTNVKPVHYDLTLEPDFEKFTYEGTVIIE